MNRLYHLTWTPCWATWRSVIFMLMTQNGGAEVGFTYPILLHTVIWSTYVRQKVYWIDLYRYLLTCTCEMILHGPAGPLEECRLDIRHSCLGARFRASRRCRPLVLRARFALENVWSGIFHNNFYFKTLSGSKSDFLHLNQTELVLLMPMTGC
jgi:hypothetical protein